MVFCRKPSSIASLNKLLGAAALTFVSASATAAGEYPNKHITMMVGYPPGGTADRTARVLADVMGKELGQPVVVENRGGASQTIAGSAVARAQPDGYTILLIAEIDFTSAVINSKNISYKLSDFRSVCGTATSPYVGLAVRADSRFKTVQEVVAALKAKPGSLSWGTGGYDTGHYWTMELFRREAGVDVLHVPYQGGGPAVQALVSGQVDLMGGSYALVRPLIAAGTIRALLVQGPNRIADLPGVPSYKDMGWTPALKLGWMHILVPKQTPDAVVQRLTKSCSMIQSDQRAQKALRDGGAEPVFLDANQAHQMASNGEKELRSVAAASNATQKKDR